MIETNTSSNEVYPMNSIKPFTQNPSSRPNRELFSPRNKNRELKQYYIQRAIENSLKITFNVGLISLSIISIQKLLPYNSIQQTQISKIEQEINKVSPRVEKLEESFGATFDPQLTKKVMKQNTYKVDPNLRPIFFQD